ncbi:Calmodulin-binding domain plant domain-containing protein [Dioscorea alata]|uniref:Calmodulin-binding domain plant domain-containing protein n=1 Tax=Dioscorea alata TaxID=55571 RepID=A0ACB7WJJ0_DIOAL|nr:Calmodulin-binding domain plant domain-containing protein [Dioscorea alata]
MATTRPSNLSERSNGNTSTPNGRRTPRSSPGPRDRKTPEKPIAGQVKSPASSRGDTTTKTIKTPSSSTSIATTKKPLRSPMPTTLKDRALRAPSSLPKSTSFSRTILDKTSASKTLTRSSTTSRSLPSSKAIKTPVKIKVEKVQEEIIDDHSNETVAPNDTNEEEKHEELVDSTTPVTDEDHHNALEEISVSSEPAPELHHEELASVDVLETAKEEDHEQHKEEIIKEEEEKKAGDEQVDIETKTEIIETVKKTEEMPGRRKEAAPDGNAVIEKTASRLASRKNRVLALVGAFETVISLQEPEGGQQGNHAAKEEDESDITLHSSQSV